MKSIAQPFAGGQSAISALPLAQLFVATFRIGSFPERSSGKEREELCRSAVLWGFNTVRLYGFGDDGWVGSAFFRLIEG